MFFFFLVEKCLRIFIGTISERKMRRQVENNVHFDSLRNMSIFLVNITVYSEKLGKMLEVSINLNISWNKPTNQKKKHFP